MTLTVMQTDADNDNHCDDGNRDDSDAEDDDDNRIDEDDNEIFKTRMTMTILTTITVTILR